MYFLAITSQKTFAKLVFEIRTFRSSQIICSGSISHHPGSCDLAARPLVALTFFVKVLSEKNFDYFQLKETPRSY